MRMLRSFEPELRQASTDARRRKIWWVTAVRIQSCVNLFLDGPLFDLVVVKRLKLLITRYHMICVIDR
jgi:hypothetical protein